MLTAQMPPSLSLPPSLPRHSPSLSPPLSRRSPSPADRRSPPSSAPSLAQCIACAESLVVAPRASMRVAVEATKPGRSDFLNKMPTSIRIWLVCRVVIDRGCTNHEQALEQEQISRQKAARFTRQTIEQQSSRSIRTKGRQCLAHFLLSSAAHAFCVQMSNIAKSTPPRQLEPRGAGSQSGPS